MRRLPVGNFVSPSLQFAASGHPALWSCDKSSTVDGGDVWRKLGHPEELPGVECGDHKSQVWPHLRRKCRCAEQRIQRF